MTIAISLNVNAGLVLAADSASAVVARTIGGQVGILQIYYNASKLFQLSSLPVGVLTWGVGGIGETSVEDAVRAFEPSPAATSPLMVEKIAAEFTGYIKTLYAGVYGTWPEKPVLAFMICGFSHAQNRAEEHTFLLPQARLEKIRGPGQSGMTWNGEIEAITRLEKGVSSSIGQVLEQLGLTAEQKQKFEAARATHLEAHVFSPIMPLQEAVDLARFLIQSTVGFERFKPGAPTCGGPVDVAIITKRDGFAWVSRKEVK